jgi:hypothetical protein
MKLTSKEIAKINNCTVNSVGNSSKNAPILNRNRRDCQNVCSKEQVEILKNLKLGGLPDIERRKQKLIEWNMDPSLIIPSGQPGAGRCCIAKNEASLPEEVERFKLKLTEQFFLYKEGNLVCPLCNRKIGVDQKLESSHWLSKSEEHFRQHADNVDWVHADCNRIYGDRPEIEDVESFFKTIGEGTSGISGNKENIMSKVMKSIEYSKNFSFDEKNLPYRIV